MKHNEIAHLFRNELTAQGINLDGWDSVIYNFAKNYNGTPDDLTKYIREAIKETSICDHVIGYANDGEAAWLIYASDNLDDYQREEGRFFPFCPECGVRLPPLPEKENQ